MMVHFSAIFSCFGLSSSSPSWAPNVEKVTDAKQHSPKKLERKTESSGAPIVVSYFPVNSYRSLLSKEAAVSNTLNILVNAISKSLFKTIIQAAKHR
ncbi:unnamed protein product [Dovyalis caffra]|uniref:Secreted protein n=1 Tax=Dovyalis caffra TaxID=77055 RepID=A0AAV1RD51_9ROSI|nr:unnamed protein product [Dovyalis caffra]